MIQKYDCESSTMKRKVQKKFIYEGFGFPIVLINVPMMKVMGVWTPQINYNKLQRNLLIALAHKPFPLTGNEMRFIRKYFEMNMEVFGKIFGVTHVAVSKWESKGNKIAKIGPTTEFCIRLFVVDSLKVKDKEFRQVYREVNVQNLVRQQKIRKSEKPLAFDAQKEHIAIAS